jgi:Leucine-rich repeat (LRR) protein
MLVLSGNEITKLPEKMNLLTNLKTLIVVDCPISEEEKHRLRQQLPNCDIRF